MTTALIPCPPGIEDHISTRLGHDAKDSGIKIHYLVVDDPSVIANAGVFAILVQGDGAIAIKQALDQELQTPIGFTRSHGLKSQTLADSYRLTREDKQLLDQISKEQKTNLPKCYNVLAVFDHPKMEKDTNELVVLAEAKISAGGVFVPLEWTPFKDLLNDGYKRIETYGSGYIVEHKEIGFLVTWNPKRAERLHKRRKRIKTTGQRRLAKTCFSCVYNLVWVYHRELWKKSMCYNLSSRNWNTRGIYGCCYTLQQFDQLAGELGKQKYMLPYLKDDLKRLSFYREYLLRKNSSASFYSTFVDSWLDPMLKRVGGAPKRNLEKYYTTVK